MLAETPIMQDPRDCVQVLRPCKRCGGLVTKYVSPALPARHRNKKTLCINCASAIARRSRPIRFLILSTSVGLVALSICLGVLRLLLGSLSPEAFLVGLIVVIPPYLWVLDRRFLIWSYVR
jgi:hypothetical protein